MAGDHKCPVCQSTFTRPQHVARHMRSHTGDRPYKCQHCGDQFARSDLLSRHINKCHASEKPPTTTAPSRRKGTAAASRATTSKQACDQCVTSSLPCDGANPCSKCVQRKCRCTYVKFHRQTAPSGPGHPVPQTVPPGPGRHSISLGAPRLPDEFFLAPPGTTALSSMYAASSHQYSMSNSAGGYPHDYTSLPPLASALAPSESPMPSMLQAHQRDSMDAHDAMARIRAQAEFLSRAGMMPNGSLTLAQPAPTADTSASLPGLYTAAGGSQDGHFDHRYNLPPSSQWDAQRQFQQTKDFEAPYGPRSQSHPTVTSFSAAGAAGGDSTSQTHPPTTGPSSSYDGGGPSSAAPYHHAALPPAASLYPQHHPQHHQQSRSDELGSEGDFGSDAGSTGTGPSHSMPSSTNSSAVHLPLPGFNNLRARADLGSKEVFEQRYPTGAQGQSQNPHEGEGGFSSAFGLMSLDDPNVLAGLSNDGQPFFSGINPFTTNNNSSSNVNSANSPPGSAGLSLATPTQDLLAQLKSAGGREAMDSREMRDFWKAYLKTPLTGPNSSGIMFPLQTPTGPGVPLGQGQVPHVGRPSPSRRHSRVASLPTMKTPPLFAEERLEDSYLRPSTGDHYNPNVSHSQHRAQEGSVAGGYSSNVRTTLYDAEDLKSYEQAVLARKAPMNLNLVPKRKGSLAAQHGANPPNPPIGKSKSMSPIVPHTGFQSSLLPNISGGSKISELLNRPPSSSSVRTTASSGSGISLPSNASMSNTGTRQASSSLAHVFGGDHPASADGQSNPQPAAAPDYMSTSLYRPSFKRIASQTLGPTNAKRASLGPAGWDHHGPEEEDEDGDGAAAEEEEEEDEEDSRIPLSGRPLGDGVRPVSLAAQAQS